MKKAGILIGILILFSLVFLSAENIDNSWHVNINIQDDQNNSITGTFSFVLSISNDSNCNNIISTYTFNNIQTDPKGNVAFYLESTNTSYNTQYYLKEIRDGNLIGCFKKVDSKNHMINNVSEITNDLNYLNITTLNADTLNVNSSNISYCWSTLDSGVICSVIGIQGSKINNDAFLDLAKTTWFLGSDWLSYDTGTYTLDFNSSKVCYANGTNCVMPNSTTYLPTSYLTAYGTESGGNNLGNLSYSDEHLFNITENPDGVNPSFELYVNFTDVSAFNNLLIKDKYSGGLGHIIYVELYNYVTGVWDTHATISDQNIQIISNIYILDSASHVSGGIVQVRIRHQVASFGSSHFISIDSINLIEGTTAITTNEHDSLSGRNDILTNHPNIVDVFYNKTQVYNKTNYNSTQTEDSGGILNIKESWLTSFVTNLITNTYGCGFGWDKGDVKISNNTINSNCWKVANGSDSTMDMSNRFVVGLNSSYTYMDTIGEKDGSTTHFHTFSFSGGATTTQQSGSQIASGSAYSTVATGSISGGGSTGNQYQYYEHGGGPVVGGTQYPPYITLAYKQCIC